MIQMKMIITLKKKTTVIGVEMPEGTEVILEVSGKKFTGNIPNLPPCEYTIDEAVKFS